MMADSNRGRFLSLTSILRTVQIRGMKFLDMGTGSPSGIS